MQREHVTIGLMQKSSLQSRPKYKLSNAQGARETYLCAIKNICMYVPTYRYVGDNQSALLRNIEAFKI